MVFITIAVLVVVMTLDVVYGSDCQSMIDDFVKTGNFTESEAKDFINHSSWINEDGSISPVCE